MKGFKISKRVREKMLVEHGVTADEVIESFYSRGPAFNDTRAVHDTDPATQWFISETDKGRELKILYIEYPDYFAIKSAYDANDKWKALYQKACDELTHANDRRKQ